MKDISSTKSVINIISADETFNMRQLTLRPNQKSDELVYPGDYEEQTIHFGMFENDILSGIASLYKEEFKDIAEPESWRLRGMATVENCRGKGYGKELLNKCIEHIIANNGKLFWCNARTTAEKFYEKFGMKRIGDVFSIGNIGPHVVMVMKFK